jgi:hypothetical protein
VLENALNKAGLEETSRAGAEGATALETLRQKDQPVPKIWKESLPAIPRNLKHGSADGITLSGKSYRWGI